MTEQFPASQPGTDETIAEVELISVERLAFYSDAVAAIAMTLLAFSLPVPRGHTTSQVLHSLSHYADTSYLTFLISFVVIGGHWLSHHSLFNYVARLNTHLIRVNMIWLLMIVITPFATRVLSGSGAFGIRFALYALIQIITMLALLAMSREIRRAGLLRPRVSPAQVARRDRSVLIVAAMFAISIPIAFVTEWAYLCWVLSPAVVRFARRFRPDHW